MLCNTLYSVQQCSSAGHLLLNQTLHVNPKFKNLEDKDLDISVATRPVGLAVFTRTNKRLA
jgi:hypothetical protein